MDTSEVDNSLRYSYFLSPTLSYNGLLDSCSIDLKEILNEYSSILNRSIGDADKCNATKKTHLTSTIITSNNIDNEESDITETIRIRDNFTFCSNSSGNINQLNLSELSFCTEKVENSAMSHSGNILNWIVKNLHNNYENIENELYPDWISIIDMSLNIDEKEPNFFKEPKDEFEIPDILIPKSKGDKISNNKKLDLTNLNFQNTESSFFVRKKKKVYFLSPEKLIDQNRSQESVNKLNDISFSKIHYKISEVSDIKKRVNDVKNVDGVSSFSAHEKVEREEGKIITKFPSFLLKNDSDLQWSLYSDESSQEKKIPFNNLSFETKKTKMLSRLSKVDINSDFGVSAVNFFHRKKQMKYFNTPKK